MISAGPEIRVNTTTAYDQSYPTVATLAEGGYVATWVSNGQDGSGNGIYAQGYDVGGNAVGSETRVNTTTVNNQGDPAVAALADGGYLVTWESLDQDGSGWGIYAQRYGADGDAVGSETRVNTTTASHQAIHAGLAGSKS